MGERASLARQRRRGATRLTGAVVLPAVRRSNPWVVLFTLLIVSTFNFADRFLITGLIGPIKETFGLGDGMIGLLMGPAFVVLYVVLGIPFARLADKYSRVNIIVAGCIFWSAATVATGMATGPTSLILARVAVGVGEAAFVAPAYSLVAAYFHHERRGLAFAILGLATYFGQIIGQAGGPAIAAQHDWRIAFYVMGTGGIFAGLLTLIVVREPARLISGAVASATLPIGALFTLLSRNASFVMMMFGFALGALSGVSFGFWGPELFARSYGIDPVAAKTAFAVNFGLAGLIGMLSFGALSDRMAKRHVAWPLRMAGLALAAATTFILLATWTDSFATAKWLAIPSGLLGGGWSVGMISTLQFILPDRFRAGATAMFLATTTLLAYLLGPWATGLISQSLGNDALSLRWALTVIMPLGFPAAILAWLASRRIERDRALFAVHA